MLNKMKTRSSSMGELEQKLKIAATELKTIQKLNNKLIEEREESELEIQNVISKNARLKSEMISLDLQMQELRAERDQLTEIADCHKQCDTFLEGAQSKITTLQKQFDQSLIAIDCLKKKKNSHRKHDEGTNVTYINDDPNYHNFDDRKMTGQNRIKKYIKIKTFIQKTKRYINIYKKKNNCAALRIEKNKLKDDLICCTQKLEEYELENKYNLDRIRRLENDLKNLSYKYSLSQKEIREHISVTNELLGLGPCKETNRSMSNSFTHGKYGEISPKENTSRTTLQNLDYTSELDTTSHLHSCQALCKFRSVTQVFCDGIGQGLGGIFHNHMDCAVVNNCMPNVQLNQLIRKVVTSTYEPGTNIVIMMGNSSGVTKSSLISSIDSLIELYNSGKINKILISSFPYSDTLSKRQNDKIFSLNMVLYNLISTDYSNGFLFFDLNTFISSYKLSSRKQFISKSCKISLVNLLTDMINTNTVGNARSYSMKILTPSSDCKHSLN